MCYFDFIWTHKSNILRGPTSSRSYLNPSSTWLSITLTKQQLIWISNMYQFFITLNPLDPLKNVSFLAVWEHFRKCWSHYCQLSVLAIWGVFLGRGSARHWAFFLAFNYIYSPISNSNYKFQFRVLQCVVEWEIE